MKKRIRLGAGAGYSGDRIEPAVDLAEKGQLDYLIFECLAERTIALAQRRKAMDAQSGYDPFLETRIRACLPACVRNKTKIISNMGAANPLAAMEKTAVLAKELGIRGLVIAAVTGDDVLSIIDGMDLILLESGIPLSDIREKIVSANVYLGANPIVEALGEEADVIITGRVADPALFLAPVIYAFNWQFSEYEKLGKGTLLGHLLECAGQITGGYFADPGYKEVPELANLGFPLAEIDEEGHFYISKLPASGGLVSEATCKEQLLYEIHDPANYYTPDVIADFSGVSFRPGDEDRIYATGARGKRKSGQLKVSIGYKDGYIGEGQISYAGPGALARAQLAGQIVRERLQMKGIQALEERYDIIGQNSIIGDKVAQERQHAEVRLRVVLRTEYLSDAEQVGCEVESLYTNGPAGGGGAWKGSREMIAIQSVLIPEELVKTVNHYIRL